MKLILNKKKVDEKSSIDSDEREAHLNEHKKIECFMLDFSRITNLNLVLISSNKF